MFYLLLSPAKPRTQMLQTWWLATNWLASVTWWLVHAMTTYTNLYYLAAAALVLLLGAALALYMAVCLGGATAYLLPACAKQRWLQALVVAAAWTLAEWLRAQWFTGFPWGELAYTHVDNLRGSAAILGSSGVGACLVGLCAWWALWLRRPKFGAPAVLAGFLTAAVLLPSHYVASWLPQWTTPGKTSDVTLVQGNVKQDAKFASSRTQTTSWYLQQVQQATTPLVVLPETALVQLPQHLSPEVWTSLQTGLDREQRAAIIGMPLSAGDGSYLNAVWGLSPDQVSPYVYGKHHLVPFGEFVPLGFQWLTDAMGIPLGGFSRGSLDQPPMAWDGQQLAVQICYEDVFGDELAQRLWRSNGTPTAWVNVSNLAWFGSTPAIAHHLLMARWRAMETGRPVIRATNTGATAIIDANGDVTAQLPHNQRSQLLGSFTGHSGLTPYVQWAGRWGHTPVWLLSLLVLAAAGLRRHLARTHQRTRPLTS
ncbi:apolipoprotein N-acyltransferase [Comamonadaceae bacterium M7527]|nr:apolipoprotein N-acyltransferase [Comamonadaceae bacterium M7527]